MSEDVSKAKVSEAELLFRQVCADSIFGSGYAPESFSEYALSYLTQTTSVTQALALTELIFPKLVAYRGGVFLEAHFTPENVDHWLSQPGITLGAAESVVNHIHLGIDQFADTPPEHLPMVRRVADVLAETWPGWAERTYGYMIEVNIYETLDDLEITFFSKT